MSDEEPAQHYRLSKEDCSSMALAAAKEAVRLHNAEVFGLLGYDLSKFEDVKRLRSVLDFASVLHDDKERPIDIAFAHRLRLTSTRASGALIIAVVMVIATALGAVIWEGIKGLMR